MCAPCLPSQPHFPLSLIVFIVIFVFFHFDPFYMRSQAESSQALLAPLAVVVLEWEKEAICWKRENWGQTHAQLLLAQRLPALVDPDSFALLTLSFPTG